MKIKRFFDLVKNIRTNVYLYNQSHRTNDGQEEENDASCDYVFSILLTIVFVVTVYNSCV